MNALANNPEYRDGNGFIAEVIRTSRRKTADIRVEEGAVSVVVPLHTSTDKIDQLLTSKRQWIKKKSPCSKNKPPPAASSLFLAKPFPIWGATIALK